MTRVLRTPSECSRRELAAFERLVRVGFGGSDESLPTRMLGAACLAFRYEEGENLVAIAGLKQPTLELRSELFAKARCDLDPAEWRLELGWVFVSLTRRGARIATDLCGSLLDRVKGKPVFATTRPANVPMIRILESFGFKRAGKPFLRRREELTLFFREG